MRPALLLFLLAAIVTVLIGLGIWLEPYFAGDVAITRALQAMFPDPAWATWVSRLPSAPAKYWVMALTLGGAYYLAGWKGSAMAVGAMLIDQFGSEASKTIFVRPRPSRELVTVFGTPSGFSFPSGTLTFACATFGSLAVLAARHRPGAVKTGVMAASAGMIALACLARVVLGAHWPSDVILTSVICLTWLWATDRVLKGSARF